MKLDTTINLVEVLLSLFSRRISDGVKLIIPYMTKASEQWQPKKLAHIAHTWLALWITMGYVGRRCYYLIQKLLRVFVFQGFAFRTHKTTKN